MRFLPYRDNKNRVFRVLEYHREENSIRLVTVEQNASLLALLSKYKMLNLTAYEIQAAKQKIQRMDSATLDYCKQQARSIARCGDDAIYRIATRTFCEGDFAPHNREDLSDEMRRIILAITVQLGVILK